MGDYARKLACELIRCNNKAEIIALNDRHLIKECSETLQSEEGAQVPVLRFSNNYSWKHRVEKTKDLIKSFKPDWISLQYVPYGFNKKGLPFYLPGIMKQLKGDHNWHIMFHEMWIGLSPASSLNHKFYGFFQRRITLRLIEALQPRLVTTTNLLYQLIMQKSKINVKLIPLMSNISRCQKDIQFLSQIEERYQVNFTNNKFFVIGIFGTLYPDAKIPVTVPAIIKNHYTEKNIVVIVFGKNNNPGELRTLKNNLDKSTKFIELGELSSREISSVLGVLSTAVLCTPKEYIGKSGAYAALRLHEVPVMVPSCVAIPGYREAIENYNEDLNNKNAKEWSVEFVSKQFLNLLHRD